MSPSTPDSHDLLLVIDVQNDFCAGGALAVPDADAVVPVINRLAERFEHVVLTQDWHPADHQSFAANHSGRQPFDSIALAYGEQTLWPVHCVQGTAGAAFHPQLALTKAELVLRKGYRSAIDSYSAFYENDRRTPTGLAGYLRERGIRRLFLVGLATDYCVLYSALDARREGFEAVLLLDACRGLDLDGSLAKAVQAMREAGVEIRDNL
ncbi:bifunctional nicotinamidase/pyrazinamidase [Pseudomonas knackmussii]|uniref:bifunctional nicotinamidase/pyrazinamidase n=1 Tax=Pseudomonas knackmussii TaxID=65741 RepID=UPI001362E527|nr:bifunctional nicotinamidase/pyrazinamidase [Pseudomonas knackmussii]